MLFNQNSTIANTLRPWLRRILIHLASTLALLVALEGVAVLLLRKEPVRTEQPISTRHRHLAERKHTQYDAGLGWVNIPNLAISNLYGSGKHLHINNLGFRGRHPVADEVASEARRIILSGDSFTFGYGVGDEDTWGAGLARRFGHVEVLNMGLGGYGVDQAYLRYLRDGVTLDHDLHLFSFITEDFKRMTRPRFMGYGKPVVTVREGRLVTEHVPVPPPTVRDGPTRWQTAVQKLHLVRYVNVKLGQLHGKRLAFWAGAATDTARHIFLDLYQKHRTTDRALALVYLPVGKDYHDSESDRWRAWLREHAVRHQWVFIDLVEELRKLPKDQIAGFFIRGSGIEYTGAEGHYTEAGNAWVADTLHRHLTSHTEIARRLDVATPL